MTPSPETILAAADVLRQIIKPLVERLDDLETRLRALEQRPIGVIDAGVFTAGR